MLLWRCAWLVQCTKLAALVRAWSRSAKPLAGNSGRYWAWRNEAGRGSDTGRTTTPPPGPADRAYPCTTPGALRRRHASWRPHGLGRLGAAAMSALPLFPQYATEGRFAGEIHSFIDQHGHDPCRRHVSKARLVHYRQQAGAFFCGERVSRNRAHCTGATILADVTVEGLPALQRAHADAGDGTGLPEPGAVLPGFLNASGKCLAIFESGHAASALFKTASTFLRAPKGPLPRPRLCPCVATPVRVP